MTTIHRRAMLRAMLGGGAVLTLGLAALVPDPAESAPLTLGAGRPMTTENFVDKAVVVVRRRRHRRRVCWWHRGRRVCRWR
jgi:hypothetical protein